MPSDKEPGEMQEERVRRALADQGYAQPFGISDSEIRKHLGIIGRCADFLGYYIEMDRWLIAESKGGNMQAAAEQIESTLQGLLARKPDAIDKIELRVYTNSQQYNRMVTDIRGSSGYRIDNGFLGYKPKELFIYVEILGLRVSVLQEGKDDQS